ncbi:hypothetical protein DFJ58DRAFT_790879 [Suillus subalutaceus]|uniref:uncharacterized protein n=1 Tax=Suillus subalutaceus TaxID=48586 RepID=UPI001B87325A|nr:uncharacterized protein DFJ58DRAFT_790879 [Suillus subalutaceus]KAG1852421.1 hypothetical protein DFJ58DRAFT_790879 [Suillus subalutaceus]
MVSSMRPTVRSRRTDIMLASLLALATYTCTKWQAEIMCLGLATCNRLNPNTGSRTQSTVKSFERLHARTTNHALAPSRVRTLRRA